MAGPEAQLASSKAAMVSVTHLEKRFNTGELCMIFPFGDFRNGWILLVSLVQKAVKSRY
jgi:hypothetical protein